MNQQQQQINELIRYIKMFGIIAVLVTISIAYDIYISGFEDIEVEAIVTKYSYQKSGGSTKHFIHYYYETKKGKQLKANSEINVCYRKRAVFAKGDRIPIKYNSKNNRKVEIEYSKLPICEHKLTSAKPFYSNQLSFELRSNILERPNVFVPEFNLVADSFYVNHNGKTTSKFKLVVFSNPKKQADELWHAKYDSIDVQYTHYPDAYTMYEVAKYEGIKKNNMAYYYYTATIPTNKGHSTFFLEINSKIDSMYQIELVHFFKTIELQ